MPLRFSSLTASQQTVKTAITKAIRLFPGIRHPTSSVRQSDKGAR